MGPGARGPAFCSLEVDGTTWQTHFSPRRSAPRPPLVQVLDSGLPPDETDQLIELAIHLTLHHAAGYYRRIVISSERPRSSR